MVSFFFGLPAGSNDDHIPPSHRFFVHENHCLWNKWLYIGDLSYMGLYKRGGKHYVEDEKIIHLLWM